MARLESDHPRIADVTWGQMTQLVTKLGVAGLTHSMVEDLLGNETLLKNWVEAYPRRTPLATLMQPVSSLQTPHGDLPWDVVLDFRLADITKDGRVTQPLGRKDVLTIEDTLLLTTDLVSSMDNMGPVSTGRLVKLLATYGVRMLEHTDLPDNQWLEWGWHGEKLLPKPFLRSFPLDLWKHFSDYPEYLERLSRQRLRRLENLRDLGSLKRSELGSALLWQSDDQEINLRLRNGLDGFIGELQKLGVAGYLQLSR